MESRYNQAHSPKPTERDGDYLDAIIGLGLAEHPLGWFLAGAAPVRIPVGSGWRVFRAPCMALVGLPGTGKSSVLQRTFTIKHIVPVEMGRPADVTKSVRGERMELSHAYVREIMDAIQEAVSFDKDPHGFPIGYSVLLFEELFSDTSNVLLGLLSGTSYAEIETGDLAKRLKAMHNTGTVPNNVIMFATTNPERYYRKAESLYRSRVVMVDSQDLLLDELVERYELGLPIATFQTNRVQVYVDGHGRQTFVEILKRIGLGNYRQRGYWANILNNIHELLLRAGHEQGLFEMPDKIARFFATDSAELAQELAKVFTISDLPTRGKVLEKPSLILETGLIGQVAMAYARSIIASSPTQEVLNFLKQVIDLQPDAVYAQPLLVVMNQREDDLIDRDDPHIDEWWDCKERLLEVVESARRSEILDRASQ